MATTLPAARPAAYPRDNALPACTAAKSPITLSQVTKDSAFAVQAMRPATGRRHRSRASQASYRRPANVAAGQFRPTGRPSAPRRRAHLDSSCRRSSNWPPASPQGTASGPSPSPGQIQVPSCKNPASLAGGSRDTKRSLLAVAQRGKRRHIVTSANNYRPPTMNVYSIGRLCACGAHRSTFRSRELLGAFRRVRAGQS